MDMLQVLCNTSIAIVIIPFDATSNCHTLMNNCDITLWVEITTNGVIVILEF